MLKRREDKKRDQWEDARSVEVKEHFEENIRTYQDLNSTLKQGSGLRILRQLPPDKLSSLSSW